MNKLSTMSLLSLTVVLSLGTASLSLAGGAGVSRDNGSVPRLPSPEVNRPVVCPETFDVETVLEDGNTVALYGKAANAVMNMGSQSSCEYKVVNAVSTLGTVTVDQTVGGGLRFDLFPNGKYFGIARANIYINGQKVMLQLENNASEGWLAFVNRFFTEDMSAYPTVLKVLNPSTSALHYSDRIVEVPSRQYVR